MATIFHALNNGYTGLTSAQVQINTTGHNIANAETEGYTRQRVALSAAIPLTEQRFELGSGVQVDEIARIHDEFVYNRYKASTQNKEHSNFSRKTLEEISTYFPEIDDVGIKNNLHNYLNAWASVAQDFNNISQKTILAQETTNLTDSIHDVRHRLVSMQNDLNEQLKVNVDEINRMAKEIADINVRIAVAESTTQNPANDLRDQRDKLEMNITKLVGTTVTKSNLRSNTPMHRDINDYTTNYNLSIGGFSIVDGKTFHPIAIENEKSASGFYTLYYERQDGYRFDMTSHFNAGKLGALIELRGDTLDVTAGTPSNGKIQEYINQLDAFASTLITATNNIYAGSAIESMESNQLELPGDSVFAETDMLINKGDFDIIMYDVDGNERGRRKITIDGATTMTYGLKSVVSQLNANVDDNFNNSEVDDFDDKFIAHYNDGFLTIRQKELGAHEGYTIAIEDHGTNFAGALGLHRFFDGDDARNIGLKKDFKANPSLIKAYGRADEGNNEIANKMLQLQYDKLDFHQNGFVVSDTMSNFFDTLATNVSSNTKIAISRDETFSAQLAAIKREFDSITKVSVDEELTNLVKFQTAYSANAKVITTVDKMIDTLLGLKQ